jgi:hypothetical protein
MSDKLTRFCVVGIVSLFLGACEAKPSEPKPSEAKSSEAKPSSAVQQKVTQQGLTSQSANDIERRKEEEEVAARGRREHPEWSEKEVQDYVRGYAPHGMSAETFDKTLAALDAAKSLRCKFPLGSSVDIVAPIFKRQESTGAEVVFDAIDRQRGLARLIVQNRATNVTATRGATALTFVEIAESGNPLVTVVFPRYLAGTREFYAADSEHIFIFGDISIGQYYGSCAALE